MTKDPGLQQLEDQIRGEYGAWSPGVPDRTSIASTAQQRAKRIRGRRRMAAGAGAAFGIVAIGGAAVLGAQLRDGGSTDSLTPAQQSSAAQSGPRAYDLPALFPKEPINGITFEQKGIQNPLAPAFENQSCGKVAESDRQDGVDLATDEAPSAMVSQTQTGTGQRMRVTVSDPGGGKGYQSIKQAAGYCHFTVMQPAAHYTVHPWLTSDGEHRYLYTWKADPTQPDKVGSDTAVGAVLYIGSLLVTASAQHADPATAMKNATALAEATRDRIISSGYDYKKQHEWKSPTGMQPAQPGSAAPKQALPVPASEEKVSGDIDLVGAKLLPTSAQLGGLRYDTSATGFEPSATATRPMGQRGNLAGQRCLTKAPGSHPKVINSLEDVATNAPDSGNLDLATGIESGAVIQRFASADAPKAFAEARSKSSPCTWESGDGAGQNPRATIGDVAGRDAASTFMVSQRGIPDSSTDRVIVVHQVGDYLVSADVSASGAEKPAQLQARALKSVDAMVANLKSNGLVK